MLVGVINIFIGINIYLGKGLVMNFWLSVFNKKVFILILFIFG